MRATSFEDTDRAETFPLKHPEIWQKGPMDRRSALELLASLVGVGCHRGKPMSNGSRVHEVMAPYVARGEVPGLVTLVARDGRANVDAIGIARDTIFRISSMTKPITAAAAMILIEEGKLRLDEDVDRLLPELANRRVLKRLDGPLDETEPARRAIGVRDLLTFTLGFGILIRPPDSTPIQRAAGELKLGQHMPAPQEPPAVDEWMRRFGTLPLMRHPGQSWMYNTGADVLGVLIARAAKQPLEDFMRERIFAPLGMKDTSFSVPASKLARLPPHYVVNAASGALEIYDAQSGQWSRPPAFPAGGGGLVSTIDDYFAFGQMLLEKGNYAGKRILSVESVDAMTRDQLTAEQKASAEYVPGFFENHGWGYGMEVVTGQDDSGSLGTYGWDGGMGTVWRTDPSKRLVTILMTQRAWTSPVPPDICRAFWAAAR
jgi:CubicO group peptidase (beta-lactamase class C family)